MKEIIMMTMSLMLSMISIKRSGDETGKIDKKFFVTPGGQLIIKNNIGGGSIRIVGTKNNNVSVKAYIKGKEKDINEHEIVVEKKENKVNIRCKTKERKLWLFGQTSEIEVPIDIQVPYQFDIGINTFGSVIIERINGNILGKSKMGKIEMNRIKGKVEFTTVGGNINIVGSSGEINVKTSMGKIKIEEFNGNIKANTVGGKIKIYQSKGEIQAKTSMNDIILKGIMENKGINAETNGGNIRIEVKKDISANIDARSRNLRKNGLICDLPVAMKGNFREKGVRGVINGGGPLLYARTTMGKIRIVGV